MTILYYGMLGKPHSWSHVSQSLLLEFQKQGIEIICKSTNAPKGIPPSLKVMPSNAPIQTETSLSYTIAPNLKKFNAKHKVVIANNDNSALPPGWSNLLNTHAHLVLPSSQFAYDILKDNGVRPERLEIVPHGYHPHIFNPDVEPAGLQDESLDDKFKFLVVAAPHWRKRYDLLLPAFIEEFKGDKDVALIIKCSMNSHEKAAHFHVNFDNLIKELHKTYKYEWPTIKIVTGRVESLAGLYKYADCTVLGSSAECFSLTMLESAMVKTPVITTEYGGHLDFLNHENSYLIDYVMRKCPREGQYHRFNPHSYVAEPNKEHFKELMRHVKDNYEEAKQKAELCYEQNKHLTWESAANQILALIRARGWQL